jgi:hypothetical protein
MGADSLTGRNSMYSQILAHFFVVTVMNVSERVAAWTNGIIFGFSRV